MHVHSRLFAREEIETKATVPEDRRTHQQESYHFAREKAGSVKFGFFELCDSLYQESHRVPERRNSALERFHQLASLDRASVIVATMPFDGRGTKAPPVRLSNPTFSRARTLVQEIETGSRLLAASTRADPLRVKHYILQMTQRAGNEPAFLIFTHLQNGMVLRTARPASLVILTPNILFLFLRQSR